MTIYVDVAVNIPNAAGVFSYHLPPELAAQVRVGHLVRVPFGRQTAQGVVLSFSQPPTMETKAVQALIDPAVAITGLQIGLAQRMAFDWLSPLAACIGLMLPPGVEQQADQLYTAQGRRPETLTKTQTRLLDLLYERGALAGRQIERAMPRVNWRASMRSLLSKGAVKSEAVLPETRMRPKVGRTLTLAVSPEQAEAAMSGLGRAGTKAIERRQAMLRFLIAEGGGPLDVAWVYAAAGGANSEDLKLLAERGLVSLGEVEMLRDPLAQANIQPYLPPTLTADQQNVLNAITSRLDESAGGKSVAPILLHGVTGSGKTEIYLHAVQHVLDQGRQAIVLVPEIALTPQTVRRFAGRFPGRVGVFHSGLSDGERYDTWRRARSGELSLIVGPRSALFTPLERLGLIVVDEFHDDSYYQSEARPYYHAREVAVRYAALAGAVCLFGSATPDVAASYHAQQGQWQFLKLPARILAHRQAVADHLAEHAAPEATPGAPSAQDLTALPPVTVVDMREELKQGNRSIFSQALQDALRSTLAGGLQAILFLNRRGSATYVFCRDCGHTLKCPQCDMPLTFHEGAALLRCHYCGYSRRMPRTCPKCNSERIRHFGTGVQRVESDVQALLPGVRTLRWDHDTTRQKGAHQRIMDNFAGHQADVLVGTQMLAKGLDLPLVTLVGVVLADVGLNLGDFRSGERTFQVLTQVAGRAGRSRLGGQVIFQTFQPEHYVIQAAAGHDYAAFYRHELAFRREHGYPPFTQLVRMEYRHYDNTKAEAAAQGLAARLKEWIAAEGRRATRLIGPAPCFFARVDGLYRWQIVLSGPDPAALLRGRDLGEWKVEPNPPNLL